MMLAIMSRPVKYSASRQDRGTISGGGSGTHARGNALPDRGSLTGEPGLVSTRFDMILGLLSAMGCQSRLRSVLYVNWVAVLELKLSYSNSRNHLVHNNLSQLWHIILSSSSAIHTYTEEARSIAKSAPSQNPQTLSFQA